MLKIQIEGESNYTYVHKYITYTRDSLHIYDICIQLVRLAQDKGLD